MTNNNLPSVSSILSLLPSSAFVSCSEVPFSEQCIGVVAISISHFKNERLKSQPCQVAEHTRFFMRDEQAETYPDFSLVLAGGNECLRVWLKKPETRGDMWEPLPAGNCERWEYNTYGI